MTTVLPDEWICGHCGARLVWGINHYEPCCDQQEPVKAPIHYRARGANLWERPLCGAETWLNTRHNAGEATCFACRALLEVQGVMDYTGWNRQNAENAITQWRRHDPTWNFDSYVQAEEHDDFKLDVRDGIV